MEEGVPVAHEASWVACWAWEECAEVGPAEVAWDGATKQQLQPEVRPCHRRHHHHRHAHPKICPAVVSRAL